MILSLEEANNKYDMNSYLKYSNDLSDKCDELYKIFIINMMNIDSDESTSIDYKQNKIKHLENEYNQNIKNLQLTKKSIKDYIKT